jgi:methyl-accepting chemotaxis protein
MVINFTAKTVQEMGLETTKNIMHTGQQDKIKLGTQTMAVALAAALRGVTDRQEQHDIIKSYIQDYRFEEDNSGYYFTYIGTTIFMHPTLPQREGEDLGNTQDKNGVYYVRELYEAAQRGGGFVEFVFPKPPSMDIAPKSGYVEYIPDTDIWISTGVYIDNIETTLDILRIDASAELRYILIITIGIIVAGIIVILVPLCVLIMRSITKPINAVADILKDISQGEGDLTKAIPETGRDEISALSHYFNLTLDKIKKLIIIIKQAADTLSDIGKDLASQMTETSSAVRNIDTAIKNINGKVINQSASVTETNATMEQITLNINKLNGNIDRQSSSVAKSSSAIEEMLANINSVTNTLIKNNENVNLLKGTSEVGRKDLQEVVEDIKEIARESESLLEINSVMKNIASQTNLLSMNAAIEAAHAGESGKGFSVVADEIRKLAENSSGQSKTISDVLKKRKNSIDKIAQSTEEVLNKFGAIDGAVRTVAEQEENIRNVMEEQSQESRQILEAIGQLGEITRQVKNGSLEMLEGSNEVIKEGKNLSTATTEITEGMNEMASGAMAINSAVIQVSELSGKNHNGINTLMNEVSRFKVE